MFFICNLMFLVEDLVYKNVNEFFIVVEWIEVRRFNLAFIREVRLFNYAVFLLFYKRICSSDRFRLAAICILLTFT